jgi:hypothetical protein
MFTRTIEAFRQGNAIIVCIGKSGHYVFVTSSNYRLSGNFAISVMYKSRPKILVRIDGKYTIAGKRVGFNDDLMISVIAIVRYMMAHPGYVPPRMNYRRGQLRMPRGEFNAFMELVM